MIEHVWTLVCSRAVIDRDTNNISIQNVIEQLRVEGDWSEGKVGYLDAPFEIVSSFIRSDPAVPAKGFSRVNYLTADGECSVGEAMEADLTEYERLRTRRQVKQLPIRRPGYTFFIVQLRDEDSDEWTEVARIPLKIEITEPTQESDEEKSPALADPTDE